MTLNPYIQGLYEPVAKPRPRRWSCKVVGEIPKDLHGSFVRNGPNPAHEAPEGMHHWFDGDGMVHAVYFENGKVEYRNRYIGTDDYRAEKAGPRHPCADGVLASSSSKSRPDSTRGDLVYKDTANTDLVFHNGWLMALWYISGKPVRVERADAGDASATETFGGALPRHVSAHGKVDPRTGEFCFFDYSL